MQQSVCVGFLFFAVFCVTLNDIHGIMHGIYDIVFVLMFPY